MSKRKLVLANNPLLAGPALNERERFGAPYRVLPLTTIDADASQPRVVFDSEKLNELANSIRRYGVLSPILVRPGAAAGKYVLISGERRLRAAKLAGLDSIPAIVDQRDEEGDYTKLSLQLVENIQRADLTPLERSQAIGVLRDRFSLSVRDIAEKLGISKSMVQRSLEILELPDDLLNALKEGASESKVLLLQKIDDPAIRASYLRDLETLTRNDLEKKLIDKKGASKKGNIKLDSEDLRLLDELRRSLGLKVKIVRSVSNNEAGRLSIDFYSSEDLKEVFRRLVNADVV